MFRPNSVGRALARSFCHTVRTGAGLIKIQNTIDRFEVMKVRNSLKSLRARDRNNRLVRRKGRLYVINKKNPRFKARQG